MSLQDWRNSGWLRPHQSSQKEVRGLLSIVERDLSDAREDGISADWRLGIAYNAALKLCAILLHASGYRAENTLQHYRTIQAMPLILGAHRKNDADYLDKCRMKRNTAEYNKAGVTSEAEAKELLDFAATFRSEVMDWLKKHHPELLYR